MQSWQAEQSSHIDDQPRPAPFYPSMPYPPQEFRAAMGPRPAAGTPVGMFGRLAFHNGFECADARGNGMYTNNFFAAGDAGRGMPRATATNDFTHPDPFSQWAPAAPQMPAVSEQQDVEMVDILDCRAADPSPPPPPPAAIARPRRQAPRQNHPQQRRPKRVPFYHKDPARTPDDFLVTIVDEGMLREEQGQEYVDWHEYALDYDRVLWGQRDFHEVRVIFDPHAPKNAHEEVPVAATFSGRGGCYPGCSLPTGFPPPLRW